MSRSALGTFIVLNALALSGCSTFAGEVVTRFDVESGKVTELSCKGFHASLGESKSGCLETEGISGEGSAALGKAIDAAGKAVNLITPPILRAGSSE